MNSDRNLFDGLFTTYLAIAVVVAIIVFAALAYALVRGHRRSAPDLTDPEPRNGNLPFELAVASLTLILVAFLMVRSFTTNDKVTAQPAARQQVEVTAFQWGWRFTYPDAGFAIEGNDIEPPELVVPASEEIAFTLRARDVIHSFWIPSERFKRDAIPERVNRFNLVFDRPENTFGQCAEFCGLEHANMDFDVTVMEPAAFRAWLARHGRGAAAAARGSGT